MKAAAMRITRRCQPTRCAVSGTSWWRRASTASIACATLSRIWATGVRAALAARGIRSVAAEGFGAPGVVVSYTDDPDIRSGAKFAGVGMQIAAGVPLRCDEPEDYSSFRLGLFGLDKLKDIDGTVATLEKTLDTVL